MTIHKEGYASILIASVTVGAIIYLTHSFSDSTTVLHLLFYFLLITLWGLVVYFFRLPNRKINTSDRYILCPADGKIVAIEEVTEHEYLNEKCIQVSVFMSPLNVHCNFYPISGRVSYSKYHPGKYLVAFHPKSSELNERTTVVIENTNCRVLMRQIAGALARRIVCYSKQGDTALQGTQMGFIKFGSRVDLFLPLNANIKVKLNQKVKGLQTVIASLDV